MIQSKTLQKSIMGALLLFLLLFVPLFVSSVYCATPTETQITLTQAEYRTLNKNLLQLDKNNQELSSKIKMLENQSQIALLSTSEQAKQLQAVKNTIDEQNKQLQLANQNLQKQQESLMITQNSLAKAEAYLNEQKKELERANKDRRTSKLLNILLGGTVIYLAVKN